MQTKTNESADFTSICKRPCDGFTGTNVSELKWSYPDVSSKPCDFSSVYHNSNQSMPRRTIDTSRYSPNISTCRYYNGTNSCSSNTDTSTCGYDSDTEQDYETLSEKRQRFRRRTATRVYMNTAIGEPRGLKRKMIRDNGPFTLQKRTCTIISNIDRGLNYSSTESSSASNTSSSSDSDSNSDTDLLIFSHSDSDSDTDSSSSSNSSSDSSSSDNDDFRGINYNTSSMFARKYLKATRKVVPCLDTCACKNGQTSAPVPIERRERVVKPLYQKVLQRRMLSLTNTFSNTCCNKECYRKWERQKISACGMVRDYHESDLRVDHYSWGTWKQEPEVNEDSSSDEDWPY